MTEKDPITPKGYVQEFIEVLKAEIEELKQSKDNNIILMNGILFESKNGYNIYQFDTKQPFSPQDNVVYKIAVSYTHLDVYKRQGFRSVMKWRGKAAAITV